MISVRFRVRWGDCDPAGIAFYPRFFEWMDMCSHDLHTLVGISRTKLQRGLPLLSVHAEFLSPARVDEELEVRSSIVEIGKTSMKLRYEIVRTTDSALVASATERRVHVMLDQGTGKMVPSEITPEMRAQLGLHLEPKDHPACRMP